MTLSDDIQYLKAAVGIPVKMRLANRFLDSRTKARTLEIARTMYDAGPYKQDLVDEWEDELHKAGYLDEQEWEYFLDRLEEGEQDRVIQFACLRMALDERLPF